MGCWVRSTVGSGIFLWDGISGASTYHSKTGEWEWLQITYTTKYNGNRLRYECFVDAAGIADFYGAVLVKGNSVSPTDFSKPSDYHELKQISFK